MPKKLKPFWTITDIPKNTKIKLWRLMKDNPTYQSWEEAITGKSYTTEQDKIFTNMELVYIKTSKDTYSSLKNEVMLMPVEEVKTLPQDLQQWIFGIRADLKGERGETQIHQKPYEETPHKQEESLIVHGLSPGATDVEFLVTNMSNNLLVVDRICVEIMHWDQYDARLTTGARIIDYKYKVNIKPNLIAEIPMRTPKFKYAKGDVDSFSISFISPPGYKYITRINFYCSDPETGKRFAVSTDKFEIRFHKHRIVSGEGTSSIHGAIAQAQKLIDEAKRKK